jgi:hypothetical protein
MAVSSASSASDSCGKLFEKPPAARELLFKADGFGDFHEGAPCRPRSARPDEHMLVRHGLEHLDWVLQRRQSFAREVVWAEQSPGAKLLKMSELCVGSLSGCDGNSWTDDRRKGFKIEGLRQSA